MEKLLLPLGTLVLGWFLSQFTQYLGSRRQRRFAVGRALAELLEVRYYLCGIDILSAELARLVPLPLHEALKGIAWLENLLPFDPQLPDRFNAALVELAATSPLLANKLKTKEQIPLLISKVRRLAPNDSAASAQLAYKADRFLRTQAVGPLNQAILELAWHHGLVTWHKTRTRLKQAPIERRECQQVIEQLLRDLRVTAPSQAPSAPEPMPAEHV